MRLVIAGGGTGGHIFPGVAIAEAFKAAHPDADVVFVGTARGLETKLLPPLGWRLELINVSGLKTVGLWGKIRGIFRLPRALFQSWRLLRKLKPDAVIGVGGYASGPVVLVARLGRRPTGIVEQNSIPGLTNKIAGKFVHAVFLAFAETRRFFKKKKIVMTGNPVRKEIAAASGAPAPDNTPPRVLIIGGSQGAVAVNELVVAAVARLATRDITVDIVHQTGARNIDATRELWTKAGIEADCRAFIEDMASEYTAADLVVARAGATSVAELTVVGCPAFLIPYPYAADNHQEINAKELADAGAARLFKQADLDADKLADELDKALTDGESLANMRQAMRRLGRPDAASDIVAWCDAQIAARAPRKTKPTSQTGK